MVVSSRPHSVVTMEYMLNVFFISIFNLCLYELNSYFLVVLLLFNNNDRCIGTSYMKLARVHIKNLVLSTLVQSYKYTKIGFNTYNYMLTLFSTIFSFF